MKRELQEWRKGRKRSPLPAVACALLLALGLLAAYVGGLVSERSFQEELLLEFPGSYAATRLVYQAGAQDVQGLSDAMGLPCSLEISKSGSLTFNGTLLLEESELSAVKIGREEESRYEEAFGEFARENPLLEDGGYLILLSGNGETAAFCYTDGGLFFTPDSVSVYEIKKLDENTTGKE